MAGTMPNGLITSAERAYRPLFKPTSGVLQHCPKFPYSHAPGVMSLRPEWSPIGWRSPCAGIVTSSTDEQLRRPVKTLNGNALPPETYKSKPIVVRWEDYVPTYLPYTCPV